MANTNSTSSTALYLAWAFVGIPLVVGIVMTILNAATLFS